MKKLGIIIVLYKVRINDSTAFNCLKKQLTDEKVLFYDNSPESDKTISSDDKIFYINDKTNPGVSKAYNEGAKFLKSIGCEWVVLLDQDTFLPDNFISVYIDAIMSEKSKLYCPSVKLQGEDFFISPGPIKIKRVVANGRKYSGSLTLQKYAAINSGLLICIDAFDECGGYNENVPLDFSDFQFFDNFSRYNDIFLTLDIELEQDLSGAKHDFDSLYSRFRIYCYCASKCNKKNFIDRLQYFYVVFGRSILLSLRTRKLSFLKFVIENYFRGKDYR